MDSRSWLAGFLEGEGTFDRNGNSPRIQAWNTQRDVLRKVARLLDCNVHGLIRTSSP